MVREQGVEVPDPARLAVGGGCLAGACHDCGQRSVRGCATLGARCRCHGGAGLSRRDIPGPVPGSDSDHERWSDAEWSDRDRPEADWPDTDATPRAESVAARTIGRFIVQDAPEPKATRHSVGDFAPAGAAWRHSTADHPATVDAVEAHYDDDDLGDDHQDDQGSGVSHRYHDSYDGQDGYDDDEPPVVPDRLEPAPAERTVADRAPIEPRTTEGPPPERSPVERGTADRRPGDRRTADRGPVERTTSASQPIPVRTFIDPGPQPIPVRTFIDTGPRPGSRAETRRSWRQSRSSGRSGVVVAAVAAVSITVSAALLWGLHIFPGSHHPAPVVSLDSSHFTPPINGSARRGLDGLDSSGYPDADDPDLAAARERALRDSELSDDAGDSSDGLDSDKYSSPSDGSDLLDSSGSSSGLASRSGSGSGSTSDPSMTNDLGAGGSSTNLQPRRQPRDSGPSDSRYPDRDRDYAPDPNRGGPGLPAVGGLGGLGR